MQPMLTTSNLRVGYRLGKAEKILFENLNLELAAGQLVCFMGPNGVGKSSLIRTIAGLQNALAGEISFREHEKDPAQLISVVLTDRIASGNMTVYDLVAFGRYPYLGWNVKLSYEDEEIIYRAIAHVRIESLMEAPLHVLSDGQLQMAMIARAIAQDTPIILLDEPTAHLDLNNRVEIMRLLRRLAKTMNKAVLVASHELDLALQTADWIWLTGRDKNILSGMPEDLVLDGSFDTIFQFKGFDLKTGKVQHQADRNLAVSIAGDGYEFLWTKNALERNGFSISTDKTAYHITVLKNKGSASWLLQKPNGSFELTSLHELIKNI
ncbi:MAG TPA: ABC transporter ATP-binding protein [Chryseosolibacter sp.]